ncbi:MAG: hypothetical protein K0R19_1660 [Bacillota bacterium]|nr:hypothetical protein [Bacillota bacterium]
MQPARLKEVRPNAEKKFKTQAPIWEKIPGNIQRIHSASGMHGVVFLYSRKYRCRIDISVCFKVSPLIVVTFETTLWK